MEHKEKQRESTVNQKERLSGSSFTISLTTKQNVLRKTHSGLTVKSVGAAMLGHVLVTPVLLLSAFHCAESVTECESLSPLVNRLLANPLLECVFTHLAMFMKFNCHHKAAGAPNHAGGHLLRGGAGISRQRIKMSEIR